MDFFARAVARLTEFSCNAQIFQVGQLLLLILLHLQKQPGHGSLWHAFDNVLLLVEVKGLLAIAQTADFDTFRLHIVTIHHGKGRIRFFFLHFFPFRSLPGRVLFLLILITTLLVALICS